MNIADLQTRAYSTACAKGWHKDPLRESVQAHPLVGGFAFGHGNVQGRVGVPMRNVVHHDRVLAKIALIHSELGEVDEAQQLGDYEMIIDPMSGKPEGFVVEAADAFIRILDLCGALDLDLAQAVEQQRRAEHWLDERDDSEYLNALASLRIRVDRVTEAVRVDDWALATKWLASVVLGLVALCNARHLDIGSAIEAKMTYNETRPHRHGGKQA